MDVCTGSDQAVQPLKAHEGSDGKKGVAAAVADSLVETWQTHQQQPEHDLEGCYTYTATPLPALPTARFGPPQRSKPKSWQQNSEDERPKQLTPQPQPPTLQPWCCSLQHTLLKAAARPFSDPAYCSTGFLQAAVALLLPVALTPLGIALQLHSTPGFTAADRGPWAGVLYVAAAVPLLRLLAGPAAYVLFSLGELLVLGFPLFSKVPRFDRMMQLHRFSWLLVSLLLLAWHAVVYKALLHQPLEPWTGRADLDVCAAQAAVQARYACTHQLVYNYSLRVLCCGLLACTASCVSAAIGMWLMHRALAAHSLVQQDHVPALIQQELYLALLLPKGAAGSEAAQTLLSLSKQHSPLSCSEALQPQLWQQQEDDKLQCLPVHQQAAGVAIAQQSQPFSSKAGANLGSSTVKAAAGCAGFAAAASVAVVGLSIAVLVYAVPQQPAAAVAAAVGVPAAIAAAAGAVAALAAMMAPTTTVCPASAPAACSSFAAMIAFAACAVPATMPAVAPPAVSLGLVLAAAVALLAAAAAAMLQLVAVEPAQPRNMQHCQRAQQVATWQVLCNAMQYYIDTCCNRTPAASSPLDCSTWDNLFNREWQQQGSDAWQQLVSKAVPSKSCDTVDSLSVEELRLLFADLVPGSAAAGDEALSWLDCDKDGKVTKADVQELVSSRNRALLCLARTLDNKREVAMGVEAVVQLMIQAVFVVLYLAVFDIGTQLWSGTVAAIALLLLGCIWLFGDTARQAISDASWLLTANPFSVGDTITFNGAEWRVLRICLNTSTLQCLATGTPHTVLNSELRSHSTSLANKSRCSAFTAAVKQSIIGMPAAKLGSFMEVLQEAVAQQAAAQPALYRAGSSRVSVLGDRLVCNGTVDFMEAELLVEWQAACAASDTERLTEAKAGMLKVMREQYACFLQPSDSTRSEVNMWSNPVCS